MKPSKSKRSPRKVKFADLHRLGQLFDTSGPPHQGTGGERSGDQPSAGRSSRTWDRRSARQLSPRLHHDWVVQVVREHVGTDPEPGELLGHENQSQYWPYPGQPWCSATTNQSGA